MKHKQVKKMKKLSILIIVFICTHFMLNASVKLVTTGIGPTKSEAIMDAQRKAVEQGVGVFIDSQSLTENLMLVEDKIFSRSRGFVKNYSVSSESKQSDGNWKVVVECEVEEEKLKLSLDALGILRRKMGNPRIMVIYDQTITGGIEDRDDPIVSEVYEGIVEYLSDREFPVAAKRAADQLMLQDFATPDAFFKESVKLGLKREAEYLLLYNITLQGKKSTDLFHRGFVMISARLINTSTGQIYANQSKKVMGVDKDSLDYAYRKAGRKAGILTAKFLEQKVVKRWQADSVSGRVVILDILNVPDFPVLVKLKEQLKDTHGVRNIVRRDSIGKSTRFEITYVGDIDTLTGSIHEILKKMGLKTELPTTSGDRIIIELK